MAQNLQWKRFLPVAAVFLGVWLLMRYLFPLFAPFLLGFFLAVLAEPLVKIFQRRLHLRRGAACFAAVTAILAAVAGAAGALVVLAVQRAAALARAFGGLSARLQQVENTLVELAAQAPGGLSEPLQSAARGLFQPEGELMTHGTKAALDAAGKAAEGLPGLLMLLGTAILAGYMLSVRLPSLRSQAAQMPLWKNQLRPALTRLRSSAGCWLKAQCKLSAVTFAIVLTGYLLLGVKGAFALALLTAVVDAVPLLGTGTVLLPWALVCLLQGQQVRAIGLLGVYLTALLVRSSLEPRLVGQHLGLSPLTALAALYTGYRLWGFGGMILAPILTVTAIELARE